MLASTTSIRILVIDDDDVDRERVCRCLQRSCIKATMLEAESGRQAVDILSQQPIDCVLLDNRLGDTTGSALLKTIRELTPYQGPIIMVTGAGSEALVVETMQEGASDYVPKLQLDSERLTQAILRSLKAHESKAAEAAAARHLSNRLREQAQRLEQLDRTLQDILDQAPNVIAYWDQEQRIQFGNGAHHTWFGVPAPALADMHVKQLLGPELYAIHAPHIHLALSGKAQRFEHTIPGADGRDERIVRVDYRPDTDANGGTQGFYVTFSDMTELALARNAAQESARLKSAFLANMSHEIRTPMNAILGLLRLTLEKPLPASIHKDIDLAHEAAMALMGILDDILDHSRLEAGRLRIDPQPLVIDDVLRRSVSLFSGRIRQKQLDFQVEISPDVPWQVRADGLRLSQVINNLLGNAVKFTSAGRIGLRVSTTTSDRVRFEVSDTGPGVSAGRQEALFSDFTQEDASVTRQFGGSGLGLSICRSLVELMDGQIGVSSTLGQGSTFWFEIPLDRCEPDSPEGAMLDGSRVVRWSVAQDIPGAWRRYTPLDTAHWRTCATFPDVEATLLSGPPRPGTVLLIEGDSTPPSLVALLTALQRQMRAANRPWPAMVIMNGNRLAMTELAPLELLGEVRVLPQPVLGAQLFETFTDLHHDVIDEPPAAPAESPWLTGGRLEGRRVLLVEDNVLNQMVARAFLEQIGMDITIADDGAQALAMIQAQDKPTFDAILMDMHMPVMDGLTATRHIRALAGWRTTPIIAMTAAVMEEDQARCSEAGMVDMISKPIIVERLIEILLKWIPGPA